MYWSGKDLPADMLGPRITKTVNGEGLLMTSEKDVYRFKCDSPDYCYWVEEDYDLSYSRRDHVLLTVPSTLLEDCWTVKVGKNYNKIITNTLLVLLFLTDHYIYNYFTFYEWYWKVP